MKVALGVLVGLALGFGGGYLAFNDTSDDGPSISAAEAEQLVRQETDADEARCHKAGDEFSCQELYIQYGGSGSMQPRGQSRVYEQDGKWVVHSGG